MSPASGRLDKCILFVDLHNYVAVLFPNVVSILYAVGWLQGTVDNVVDDFVCVLLYKFPSYISA